jgi:hypothetical protein
MTHSLRRLRHLALFPAFALAAGCGDPTVSVAPDVIPGTYKAVTFIVTPPDQAAIDVLAKGGTLTVNVGADAKTSGSLFLPAGLLSTFDATVSMNGELVRTTDGNYWFDLLENSFMRDLVWQQFTDAFASNSVTGQTQFQIVLKK